MQFKKSVLEFEVMSLSEAKVLLRAWNDVLARSFKREAHMPRQTENHMVTINLDDRQRPQEPVVLQFLGPPALCKALVADLQAAGYACPRSPGHRGGVVPAPAES